MRMNISSMSSTGQIAGSAWRPAKADIDRRDGLVQQLELLRHQHAGKEVHTRGVSARPVDTGHET